MPPDSWVKSETARISLVAAFMLAVLLASIGAAYQFTEARGRLPDMSMQRLGDLSLALPVNWRLAQAAGVGEMFGRVLDPAGIHELEVFEVDFPTMVTPDMALGTVSRHSMVVRRIGRRIGRSQLQDLGNDQLKGVRYATMTGDVHGGKGHVIAVGSADRRRYAVLLLIVHSDDRFIQSSAMRIFNEMCGTARIRGREAVEPVQEGPAYDDP